MLLYLFERLSDGYHRKSISKEHTRIVAYCPIIKIYHLEKGTIPHKLAQESLILIEHSKTPPDCETFTDNGDLTLSTLYADLCTVYTKDIRKEQSKRLRGI